VLIHPQPEAYRSLTWEAGPPGSTAAPRPFRSRVPWGGLVPEETHLPSDEGRPRESKPHPTATTSMAGSERHRGRCWGALECPDSTTRSRRADTPSTSPLRRDTAALQRAKFILDLNSRLIDARIFAAVPGAVPFRRYLGCSRQAQPQCLPFPFPFPFPPHADPRLFPTAGDRGPLHKA